MSLFGEKRARCGRKTRHEVEGSECQGVWLDSGELEKIKGGVEANALMAMASGFTVPFG